MRKTVVAGLLAGTALVAAACGSGDNSPSAPTYAAPADPEAAMTSAARDRGLNREELAVALNRAYDTCRIVKDDPTSKGRLQAVNEVRRKLGALYSAGLVDDVFSGDWIVDRQVEYWCPDVVIAE